jgi:KUP system potassium uptake protein
MISTLGLVVGFQTSSKLAAAYGVAVTSTMLVTTLLFLIVARRKWGWSRLKTGALAGLFLVVDIPFFCANISKIFHGAWFPLLVGGVFFISMSTWKKGRRILKEQMADLTPTIQEFRKSIEDNPPQKVKGQAVFLTGNPERVPLSIIQNLIHNKILHTEIAILHFKTEAIPRVPSLEKVAAEKLFSGFYRIIASHGFMEAPKVEAILALAQEKGVEIKWENTSFFLGREKLIMGEKPKMSRWRSNLFLFLSRNSMDASSFFGIPSNRIIEVGVQLEL